MDIRKSVREVKYRPGKDDSITVITVYEDGSTEEFSVSSALELRKAIEKDMAERAKSSNGEGKKVKYQKSISSYLATGAPAK